jgi:hypothetical protein
MHARVGHLRVADMAQFDKARKVLETEILPRVRQAPGAVAGYFLEPVNGEAMGIIVFDSKEAAERPVPNAQPGESPAPGVTVERVEIREVIGNF